MMAFLVLDCQYLPSATHRRHQWPQLNRGEARHRLARATFYGKRGELHQFYRARHQGGALSLANLSCVGQAPHAIARIPDRHFPGPSFCSKSLATGCGSSRPAGGSLRPALSRGYRRCEGAGLRTDPVGPCPAQCRLTIRRSPRVFGHIHPRRSWKRQACGTRARGLNERRGTQTCWTGSGRPPARGGPGFGSVPSGPGWWPAS